MSDSENDPKLAAGNLPILAWLDGSGGDSRPWRRAALVSLVLVVTAVGILRMMGRTWWCQCETLHFWIGDNWSSHNSQHLLDPYTFSHFQHGLLLYGLLFMVAKKWNPAARMVVAIALESSWEVLENTSWIIEKYRESTMSLDYYGDSILNSVSDIASCALGFGFAGVLPAVVSVLDFVTVEVAMLVCVRDSLLLNMIMLFCPIDRIKDWQMSDVMDSVSWLFEPVCAVSWFWIQH